MRVSVTGASGFIGRALCPALYARGHQVESVRLREDVDVSSFAGVDAVVHLAAIAHRRGVDEDVLLRVNTGLAHNVGRAAAAAGARMVFLSSIKVHGDESNSPLSESSAVAPADAYAASKAKAEALLCAIPNLRLTVLRPPLVYGPAVKANFLALMTAIARGLPLPLARIANRRSLLYVANLGDAIVRCVENPELAPRAYLVSDGAPLSTPQLCREIGKALGRQARLFPIPARILELIPGARRLTRSLVVDDAAIRRELGWHPPFSFEEGLRATADWYCSR